MATPIKAVLVAIIASAALFLLTHLAFFFPFYITVVVETFNLANVAANDNYVKYEHWKSSLDGLLASPMISKAQEWEEWSDGFVSIEVIKGTPFGANGVRCENLCAAGMSCKGDCAIGANVTSGYSDFYYDLEGWGENARPYRQRGYPVTVTVRAVYPFEIAMWDWRIRDFVHVSYSITTIGLKYYKDLDYDSLFDTD